MKARGQGGVFQFEGFRLDRQSRVLLRRDEAGAFVPMAVGSRALDVLDVLLDRAGNLVLRDELMAAVWPATAVEDTNLNMQIAAIRRILDEARTGRSCIQTIPGRGYRFAVPVTRTVADASALSPSGPPPLPDKPSLAVMPFKNRSGDPEQEYFADGMVEEIITALSRITWLFVIARNSSFTYKGQAVDLKQVGRELGVRYVPRRRGSQGRRPRAHQRAAHRRDDWSASLGRTVRRSTRRHLRAARQGGGQRGRCYRADLAGRRDRPLGRSTHA
jgi:DNA-binding winged helix-turn-helix (wHTH) protein